MKNIFKKHPWISVISFALGIALSIHLFYGFEYIYPFSQYSTNSVYPSDWFNVFLALFFVLVVYLLVDSQTSSKIEQVQKIEGNIEQNTKNLITANIQIDDNIKKAEQNTQNLITANAQMLDNIHKTAFQVERTSAVYKYPESEQYKKVNEIYQPFIIALFDYEKPIIGIEINPNTPRNEDLQYEIEVVRNLDNTPRKETALHSSFYIIKILAPAYSEVLKKEDLQTYKKSPIKEGEYYACRFYITSDHDQGSWVLGQQLSIGQLGQGFYKFYPAGSGVIGGRIPSANEIMGYGQEPDNTYKLIEQFIIPSSIEKHPITAHSVGLPIPHNNQNPPNVVPIQYGIICKLFKNNNGLFLKIGDSPLKKVYVMDTYIGTPGGSYFLVFENLRGHIENEDFLTSLKTKIFQHIKHLPLNIMDNMNYEENHHIKIPLGPNEIQILKQHQPHS